MGREASCVARFDGKSSAGQLHLETDELIFRGSFLLRLPYASMSSVRASSGLLSISSTKGVAEFELGDEAGAWVDRILNPKSLLDKLGAKPGMTFCMLMTDDSLKRALLARGCTEGTPANMTFAGADNIEELGVLARAREATDRNGMIWIVIPKGVKGFSAPEVIAAARDHGLVDVKICRFSETHTAYKLVVPKALR